MTKRHIWPADDQPVISPRESAAIDVAAKMHDEDRVSEVLARFWARTHCPRCKQAGACAHRDRKKDMDLIRTYWKQR